MQSIRVIDSHTGGEPTRLVVGNDNVAELWGGIDSLPTTFLIDRDGGIAFTHVGLVSKSEYQAEIVRLIAS